MDTLGSKIRSLRKARHLTQAELGNGAVSASLISQIESNRTQPSESVLEQISQRLGVAPNYFTEYLSGNEYTHLYRRAKNLLESQQYEDAAQLFDDLVRIKPPELKLVSLYTEAGQCYYQLQDFERASTLFHHAAEASLAQNDPATAIHTYYQLGSIQRKRNLVPLAKMYWQRAHELLLRHAHLDMPISVKIHTNLGRAYYTLGQYEEAQQSYERALGQIDHDHASLDLAIAAHGLANVLIEAGNYEKALHFTRQALFIYESVRHQRGTNQCKLNLAMLLRKQKKYAAAILRLEEYLNEEQFYRDPLRHAHALSERALSLLELENPEEALKAAEQAVLMVESDKQVWTLLQMNLVHVYIRVNQNEPALAAIQRTLPYAEHLPAPRQQELRLLHVQVLVQLHQVDEAIRVGVSYSQ